MTQPPPYQHSPGAGHPPPQTFVCPKCQGPMRTYDRSGIHIEQCERCRGIFLDFGEFENLVQLESRYSQPPPAAGPAWGSHRGHHYRKKGFSGLFFSD